MNLPRIALAALLLSASAAGLSAQDCPPLTDNCWQLDALAKTPPPGPLPVAVIRGMCEGEAAGKIFDVPDGSPPQHITQVSCGFGWVLGASADIRVTVEIYKGPFTNVGGRVTLGPKVYDSGPNIMLSKPPTTEAGIYVVDLSSENIIVNGDFAVAFRVNDNPNGTCAGGMNANPFTDNDPGCPADRNILDELTEGWIDTDTFPLFFGILTMCAANVYTGDWVIRACSDDFVAPTAGTAQRNGSGLNPLIYSSLNEPIICTTWLGFVNLAAVGQSMSLLIATGVGPSSGNFLMWGELLINLAGPTLGPPQVSATGLYQIPIPNDPSFAGLQIWTQAAAFGVSKLQMTNALDLTLGY